MEQHIAIMAQQLLYPEVDVLDLDEWVGNLDLSLDHEDEGWPAFSLHEQVQLQG